MTIYSNAGGYMKIPDLGITIGPGRTVDLDTLCTPEVQRASGDLRTLISRKFLQKVGTSAVRSTDFTATTLPTISTPLNLSSLRRVVFVQP